MYRVEVRPRAQRSLRRLPPKQTRQVETKIESLAQNPRPQDYRQLRQKDLPARFRVDSGEYRIFYDIDDGDRVIVIADVRHRREAYR